MPGWPIDNMPQQVHYQSPGPGGLAPHIFPSLLHMKWLQ